MENVRNLALVGIVVLLLVAFSSTMQRAEGQQQPASTSSPSSCTTQTTTDLSNSSYYGAYPIFACVSGGNVVVGYINDGEGAQANQQYYVAVIHNGTVKTTEFP